MIWCSMRASLYLRLRRLPIPQRAKQRVGRVTYDELRDLDIRAALAARATFCQPQGRARSPGAVIASSAHRCKVPSSWAARTLLSRGPDSRRDSTGRWGDAGSQLDSTPPKYRTCGATPWVCSRIAVTVQCRRMGGGLEARRASSAHPAATAVLAAKTHRPVKLRLDRDVDLIMTASVMTSSPTTRRLRCTGGILALTVDACVTVWLLRGPVRSGE